MPGNLSSQIWKAKKTYEYQILNRRFPIPTERFYSHFTYVPLDIEKMQEAGGYLLGEHDFKSFCGAGAQVKTTVRCIHALDITKKRIRLPYVFGETDSSTIWCVSLPEL